MTSTLPPLTPSELSDLKAKAKAASKSEMRGKWHYPRVPWTCDSHEMTAHIVAANPETILRLIDVVERQQVALRTIREKSLDPLIQNLAWKALAATEPKP